MAAVPSKEIRTVLQMSVILITAYFKFRNRSTCSKGPIKRAGKVCGDSQDLKSPGSDMNLWIGKIKNYNNKILESKSYFKLRINKKINLDEEKGKPDVKPKGEGIVKTKPDVKQKKEPDIKLN